MSPDPQRHGSSFETPRCFAKSKRTDRDLARQSRVVSSDWRALVHTAGTGTTVIFSVNREENLSLALCRAPKRIFLASPALTEAENSLASSASSWSRTSARNASPSGVFRTGGYSVEGRVGKRGPLQDWSQTSQTAHSWRTGRLVPPQAARQMRRWLAFRLRRGSWPPVGQARHRPRRCEQDVPCGGMRTSAILAPAWAKSPPRFRAGAPLPASLGRPARGLPCLSCPPRRRRRLSFLGQK